MRYPYRYHLFYLTAIDNLESILERGILSRHKVNSLGIQHTEIADSVIIQQRQNVGNSLGLDLSRYVNLYFQPRNPMLYRIIREKGIENVCIIQVRDEIIEKDGLIITDGNAASFQTKFYSKDSLSRSEFYHLLKQISSQVEMEFWNTEDSSKRRIMAECLVPEEVAPAYIDTVFVASTQAHLKVRERGLDNVVPEPRLFFLPYWKYHLEGTQLTLVRGDMFFSRMQTLTISVNTRGVMGKGLASRAKYQFPHVYVFYQDLCKKGLLKMGQPYLYRLDYSLASILSEEPNSLAPDPNPTWFLLFPTKNHWREKADLRGISQGLDWIVQNYQKEGIRSLAVPALGAGLGWLEWYEVGPLIVSKLSHLSIPVEVYLPAEKEIPQEQLTPEFLLGRGLRKSPL
ncbi:MAG: DarT ssDNA thymidine ADP-ribosyltransferase family protein [Bacteroidia bacterium]|nr:DarT ssDNA thymidine ADP-ribosyltransferase family protein [Bacteroidia bacterium]MDW8133643.1 DarT ssDNA thymidine ADP-ribosyltransferase family protein [Bacteroidia bacterium]